LPGFSVTHPNKNVPVSEEHGVRRVGKLAHKVIGSSGDEVAVQDPLNESSLILVPRDFAFRMVVMGGLP